MTKPIEHVQLEAKLKQESGDALRAYNRAWKAGQPLRVIDTALDRVERAELDLAVFLERGSRIEQEQAMWAEVRARYNQARV